jgi:uncharacterized membrane protein YvbJ
MVYCSKCGQKNDDGAEYCSKCGESLKGKPKKGEDEWEKRCEDECAGGKHGAPIFWGIVVILIGLWILFEFVIKNVIDTSDLPVWIRNFEFWWIIALVIAIAIILTGFRMISRK